MKYFVTGGSGFIGSHLVDRLVSDGHKVSCLVKENSNTNYLEGLPVTLYPRIPIGIDTYDVIFHLAGVLGCPKTPLGTYQEAHVALPHKILTRLNRHQKFVYMSSNYVTCIKKPYERTKLEGEKVVEESGVDYNIVRPGFVYGPRDYHHLPLFRLVKKLRVFPMIGQGDNTVAPTYVRDVVDALVYATMSSDSIVPVAGKHIKMVDFIDTIGRVMGKRLVFVHLPVIPIPPFRELMKVDFFTQRTPFESYKEGAPLEEGLRETVDWYRKEGVL